MHWRRFHQCFVEPPVPTCLEGLSSGSSAVMLIKLWALNVDLHESFVDEVSFKTKDTFHFQCAHDRCGSRTTWMLSFCLCVKPLCFYQIDQWRRFELLLVCVGCMHPADQRSACGDEDQCTERSELCWSLSSALLCGHCHRRSLA